MSAPTTTVFIRDDAVAGANSGSGGDPFLKVERPGSITLQTLTDEFGVTSLVECDARGIQHPRALVLDRPEEVLHQNTFYVTRKRTRAVRDADDGTTEPSYGGGAPFGNHGNANKTVHFKKSVAVQEFLLPSSDSTVSRPSVDLFSGTTESGSTNPTNESDRTATSSPTLPASSQQPSAGVKLAFSSFSHIDVNTGKKALITLETFRDMMDRSRATLAEAEERHASFLKTIEEAEAVDATLGKILQRTS